MRLETSELVTQEQSHVYLRQYLGILIERVLTDLSDGTYQVEAVNKIVDVLSDLAQRWWGVTTM